MTKERKQEIIATYRRDEKDTGSPEVQKSFGAVIPLQPITAWS